MADNIFDATLDVDNDVKVNNFDWSHANNLTTQIGRITPIFCDLVPAKTSFRVNPRFGLQFMPMVFPIQTRMKARISFFRYPLRALWKDYKDFIGNFRDGLEEPYINFNTETRLKKMASTGSLGDYLGLPTTAVGLYGSTVSGNKLGITLQSSNKGYSLSVGYEYDKSNYFNTFEEATYTELLSTPSNAGYAAAKISLPAGWSNNLVTYKGKKGIAVKLDSAPAWSVTFDNSLIFIYPNASTAGGSLSTNGAILVYDSMINKDYAFFCSVDSSYTFDDLSLASSTFGLLIGKRGNLVSTDGQNTFPSISLYSVTGVSSDNTPVEINLNTSPWYNSLSANKNEQQKILAYGFRAYEGIYNSFYRDNRNNPYYLNGEVQYNTWIPNDKGGEDNELYELRYANWEKDFLTTAVQSPQQGNAPLVGITTYTQTVDNHDGTKTELVKTAIVDEDGKKYGLSFKSSSDGLEGVEYVELDNGTAVRQARSLYDLATSGISIPDLRMVNCYQKFLELNMRKGYSYKDIVEGRFAVKVRYADLLLPEFFGGVSRDIDVNSVTQTVDQNVQGQTNDYDKALGSQAGLAGVRGEANANIECFCDEESIIMGVLVVTPLPVYTQLLPKHFTYRGLMEHYQPEFNLIGFQPIKYNEVCPIQAYNADKKSLTETFGYNRPWYEYAQKYDVAHGLFRTDLSNFLMHRVFNQKPELAQSFLTVDPDQVTDVFAVTETTDKIYGQIWFDITCKLPIARVAIPRLD